METIEWVAKLAFLAFSIVFVLLSAIPISKASYFFKEWKARHNPLVADSEEDSISKYWYWKYLELKEAQIFLLRAYQSALRAAYFLALATILLYLYGLIFH